MQVAEGVYRNDYEFTYIQQWQFYGSLYINTTTTTAMQLEPTVC